MPDYLREALGARLATATGSTPDTLADVLPHLDVAAFVDEAGEIQQAAVDAFAATLGAAPSNDPPLPRNVVREALGTLSRPGTGRDTEGSIETVRRNALEKYAGGHWVGGTHPTKNPTNGDRS